MTDNTRKPVGDGDEVVVRLTRAEVQVLVGRAELPVGGVATLDTRIRTPLRDKLRAALDQEAAMSDERPDKCPTCGSDDPGKPGNDPANRGWELKVGIVPGAGWKPCPDPFHDHARLREVERELQKCKRQLTALREAVEDTLCDDEPCSRCDYLRRALALDE